MTAASKSEARKRAAGIDASDPTAQEPTPTPGDAPGADSEALAGLIATTVADVSHSVSESALNPGAIQTYRTEFTVPRGWQAKAIAELILGSSWLADHDRQIANAAAERPVRVVCELSNLLDQIAERIDETGRVGREDFLDIFTENDLGDLLPEITQNWNQEARRG